MFKKSQRIEMESEDEKSAAVPMSKWKRKLEAAMLAVDPPLKKKKKKLGEIIQMPRGYLGKINNIIWVPVAGLLDKALAG